MAVFDKTQSKIKMAILTAAGYENTAWYSRKREDKKKSLEETMDAMFSRFQKHPLSKITNVLQFYDNITGSRVPLRVEHAKGK